MLSTRINGFRYFIELAFNGTNFHGWQIQPGAVTVQETLNHSIGILVRQPVNLVGCGRTDSGVHASHFVAHVDVQEEIADCHQLAGRLNRFIGNSIRIDRIIRVDPDSHARFHALSRTYHYLISPNKTAFMNDFSWNLSIPLDVEAMNAVCGLFTGRHDFTSFSKLHTDVKTNWCEVYEAGWTEESGLLVFRIRSNRFLRNMVRAMVGTLVEVGKGRLDYSGVKGILDAQDRSKAGMSVPAKGLFLTRVEYAPEIFRAEPKPPFFNWIWVDQPS